MCIRDSYKRGHCVDIQSRKRRIKLAAWLVPGQFRTQTQPFTADVNAAPERS